jgi:hypothetical protein
MATGDSKILKDIEATADYYGPAVYSELLTFYTRLEKSNDILSSEFIPLTAAKTRNPQASKIFAVGIIPPAVNVTGRILDRSSSIAREEGVPDIAAREEGVSNIVGRESLIDGSREADRRDDKNGEVSASSDAPWGSYIPSLSDEFWLQFVGMCKRVGADPIDWAAIIYNESGFNPAAKNFGADLKKARQRKEANQPIAVGLSQFIWSCGRGTGMTREEWENHADTSAEDQLIWMERYMKRVRMRGKRESMYPKHFGGLRNPDGSAYASIAFQEFFVKNQTKLGRYPPGTTRFDVYQRSNFQQRAFDQNVTLATGGVLTHDALLSKIKGLPPQNVRIKVQQALEALGDSIPAAPLEVLNSGNSADWAANGSKDAKAAREEREKTRGTPLSQRDLGKKYQAAQRQQIAAMQSALEAMRNVPPLRLLVNPQKFSVKGAKIVSDGNWGRQGPIIEFWGDDQDSVSASGRIAAFYAMDIHNAVGPGLTRQAAKFSESWRNFMSLFMLYQNNAAMWLDDSISSERGVNNLTILGSIYIYYDNILYIGSFDTFNITEVDTAPFSVEYSFEFKVRAAYLLDRPDSENSASYSASRSSQDRGTPVIPTSGLGVNDAALFSLADTVGVDAADQEDPGGLSQEEIIRRVTDPSYNDHILSDLPDSGNGEESAESEGPSEEEINSLFR